MNELIRESLEPFWKSGKMIRESIMLVEKDGVISGNLRYKPKGKVRISNSFLTEEFKEGEDYICEGRRVVCLNRRMPYEREEILYGKNLPDEIRDDPKKFNIVNCLYSDSPYIISHQVVADYSFDRAEFDLSFTDKAREYLPRTLQKLERGEKLRILLYGDSISVGCNSSGCMNTPPYLPPWYELLCMGLEDRFGSEIRFVNTSKGGMTSVWGMENVEQNVEPYASDLMMIAFGMNDGTMKIPTSQFLENIRTIMKSQKESECEFILIASILPNPESDFVGLHEEYERTFETLKREHVCVVDMAQLHRHLLCGKRYCDMTGNNINHPNDFLARCYAMRILELFDEE